MARWRQFNSNDDAGTVDGDSVFSALNSRTNPAMLTTGTVAKSVNMRFANFTARPRKGAISQNIGIKLDNPPLVYPFFLPDEGVTICNDYTDGARASGVFHGKLPLCEVLEYTQNSVREVAEHSYRLRIYQTTVAAVSETKTERDFIALAFADKIYLFDPEDSSIAKEFTLPITESIPDNGAVSIIQAFDHLIIFRGQNENGQFLKPLIWNGDSDANFDVVADASAYYSIPCSSFGLYHNERLIVPLEYTAISIESVAVTAADSIAKFETSQDTGLKVGEKIVIAGCDTALLNGHKRIVAVQKQVINEDTFEVVTPASFSIDFDSETDFTDSGTNIQARYTSRDEYVMSGILELLEYDLINCHFRVNKGDNNYLVGFAPYQEKSIIVFMRKSVYIHSGLDDLSTSTIQLVTDQVGCIARRSIATIGNKIYFLSDEGVYSLEIAEQLTLRGSGEPLSKNIDDKIARINLAYADRACAVFCDNRYYLAVPIDGAKRNNAIFIYNTLNAAWESIDSYPECMYFDSLTVATCGGRKRVFGVSSEGGISLLEESQKGDEVGTIGDTVYDVLPVRGEIITRAYSLSSPEIKRFNRVQSDIAHNEGDRWSIAVRLENPDSEIAASEYFSTLADECTIRRPIRRNAHRAQVIFKTAAGRPELRQLVVDASIQTSDNRRT